MNRLLFALLLGSALLAGCTVGPDYKAPAPPATSAFIKEPATDTAAAPTPSAGNVQHFAPGADIPADWWLVFHSDPLDQLVRQALAAPAPAYSRIPCVCPGWDNSPRRKEGANIFINSTPEKYERWLREVVNRLKPEREPEDHGLISPRTLVFINAWNEWAEGNHLEPCQEWGRAYLEATRRGLSTRSRTSGLAGELGIEREVGSVTP